jgi:hypothetical protein
MYTDGKELIDAIRYKVNQNQYEFSKHAVDRMMLRHINVAEVCEAVANCELIEDYPQDKYGPSCLILGFTNLGGRPLHIQCSYPSRSLIKIVTVDEPDPEEWINFKVRKS